MMLMLSLGAICKRQVGKHSSNRLGGHLLQRDLTPSTLHLHRGVLVAPQSTHTCVHVTGLWNLEGTMYLHDLL